MSIAAGFDGSEKRSRAVDEMMPTYFATPQQLRAWLAKHHASEKELLVGFWKKGSGKPSITWPELVEECLCYGWIDGIRRSLGDEAYTIRITPRKRTSVWSPINVKLVAKLREEGRMTEAGDRAFAMRDEERSRHAYERIVVFDPAREKRFRAAKKAWSWWLTQPAGYRKAATSYVMTAKKEETRDKRLALVIEGAARGERIARLISPTRKS